MKALSICGPWWWYLLQGVKPVENRDWKTDYRGPLLIQVSQKILELDRVTAQEMAKRAGWTAVPSPAELRAACGHIVGVVQMVDVVERHMSPFFQGRYGWVFERPVLFREPVRCPGKLGLFDVDDSLVPAVARTPVEGMTRLDFHLAQSTPEDIERAATAIADAYLKRTFMGVDVSATSDAPAALPSDPLQRRMF